MAKFKRTLIPLSGIVYGEIIYWTTTSSAIVVLFGTIKTFIEPHSALPPAYMLNAVLSGQSVTNIWMDSPMGAVPNGHWYLSILSSGEGMTTAGLALGVFSIIPGTFISSFFLWRSNNRFFARLALAAAFITITSMVGVIPLPTG